MSSRCVKFLADRHHLEYEILPSLSGDRWRLSALSSSTSSTPCTFWSAQFHVERSSLLFRWETLSSRITTHTQSRVVANDETTSAAFFLSMETTENTTNGLWRRANLYHNEDIHEQYFKSNGKNLRMDQIKADHGVNALTFLICACLLPNYWRCSDSINEHNRFIEISNDLESRQIYVYIDARWFDRQEEISSERREWVNEIMRRLVLDNIEIRRGQVIPPRLNICSS